MRSSEFRGCGAVMVAQEEEEDGRDEEKWGKTRREKEKGDFRGKLEGGVREKDVGGEERS